MALQADNKIVVGGPAFEAFGIARLNSDGSLDTSFNQSGTTPGTISLDIFGGTSGISICHSLAIQTDQKIVVVGTNGTSIALARLNTDGSLDTTFNASGVQPGTVKLSNIDGNTNNNSVQALLIQADGKIVVVGSTNAISSTAVALARFNPDGSLDISFNANGANPGTLAIYNVDGNSINNIGLGLGLQSDQKIVVASGVATVRSPADPEKFGIIRINSDGSLDTTFNAHGPVPGTASFTVCNNETNQSNAIAIQNTNLILAGYTLNTDYDAYEFALARIFGTTISSSSNLFSVRLIEKYGALVS